MAYELKAGASVTVFVCGYIRMRAKCESVFKDSETGIVRPSGWRNPAMDTRPENSPNLWRAIRYRPAPFAKAVNGPAESTPCPIPTF